MQDFLSTLKRTMGSLTDVPISVAAARTQSLYSQFESATTTMPNNDYAPLPTEPPTQVNTGHEEQDVSKARPPRQASGPTVLQTTDPRFNPPSPSPLKRAALLLFVFCLFWFALRLRTAKTLQTLPAPATDRYSRWTQPTMSLV